MNLEFTGIVLLLLSFRYWFAAQAVKEIAYAAVRRHCQQLHLQMLDDYVALQQLSLQRNLYGKISLRRVYGFEFSATGEERYQGHITLVGQVIQGIELDAYRIVEQFNPQESFQAGEHG